MLYLSSRLVALPVLATAILMATPAFARDVAPLAKLFPMAMDALRLDRTVTVTMPNGKLQRLTSVTFTGPEGSAGGRTTTWCGLVFEPSAGEEEQGVVAVGQGFTEAVSCGGLAEAAAMPSTHTALRIGLRYRASSPHASSVEPVVVVRNKSGNWHVDNEVAERLSNVPGEVTIWRMEKLLSKDR